jgi:glucokinase
LEELASGTAIAGQAEELQRQGRGQTILEFCDPDSPVTAKEISLAARQGVPEAVAIIAGAGRYLGMALANLVNIFNPDRIVIGGGTGLGLQDLWSDQLQGCLEDLVSPALRNGLKVEFTTLGGDIGLLGCAAAVLQDRERTEKRRGD